MELEMLNARVKSHEDLTGELDLSSVVSKYQGDP